MRKASRLYVSNSAHRLRWTPAECRVVRRFARALVSGRLPTERTAARACLDALVKARFPVQRTLSGVQYRIVLEAAKLGRRPCRKHWSTAEDRVVDHFARAVVRHDYRDATAAAPDCLLALARVRPGFPRNVTMTAARIGARALELGRRQVHVIWTPGELRLLNTLARQVSSGRFQEMRQASRAFVAEMKRRGKARPVHPRTLDAVDRKLWHVARDAGLAWGFRDWSAEEERVVDRFVERYAQGEYRSVRRAARYCLEELERLAERRRQSGRGRPFVRSFSAVQQRLLRRSIRRGLFRPAFRRWRASEQRIAAVFADQLPACRSRGDRRLLAEKVRSALLRHGYDRSVPACLAELRRALRRESRSR
ncbi:hypothetical protein FJY69_06085 [candidate division WOR-3 bacterium]|nr:hypothetical protein [candidate division WOR-3 bacterium]